MNKMWLLTFVQLLIALALIFIGWELIMLIIEPSGSNWMWQTEMQLFYFELSILIICSNLIVKSLGLKLTRIRISSLIQIIAVLSWYFLGRDLFPYRHLFLMICGILTLSIPMLLTFIPAGQRFISS